MEKPSWEKPTGKIPSGEKTGGGKNLSGINPSEKDGLSKEIAPENHLKAKL